MVGSKGLSNKSALFPFNDHIANPLPFCGCTDCLLMNNFINEEEECIKSHGVVGLIGATANRSKKVISFDMQKETAIKQKYRQEVM